MKNSLLVDRLYDQFALLCMHGDWRPLGEKKVNTKFKPLNSHTSSSTPVP
jgi:hypothetical protein